MEVVKHETCLQYFGRRLSEGWKCVSLKGYDAVLLSPSGFRREIDLRHDVLTLRPNSDGTYQEVYYREGDSTSRPYYPSVDVVPDGFTTCIYTKVPGLFRDTYGLPNHTTEYGPINKVTHYACGRATGATYSLWEGMIYTNSSPYYWGGYSATSFLTYSHIYTNNPQTGSAWTWDEIDALQIGCRLTHTYQSNTHYKAWLTQTYVEVDYTPWSAPTVTTQAATAVAGASALAHGNITDDGNLTCDHRGFVYGTSSEDNPGDVAPGSSGYDDYEDESGSFGVGAFALSLTGLSSEQKYYVRAYAHNSEGYSYGDEIDFTTLAAGILIATLRPNAVGDETNIYNQTPDSGAHWDKVDEVGSDEDDTKVWFKVWTARRDLYNLTDSSVSGVISKVTVFIRCKTSSTTWGTFYTALKSGSTAENGVQESAAASNVWETFSRDWALNPDDSEAWEWADIDALQAGVRLYSTNDNCTVSCTQVWVEVQYTPPKGRSFGFIIG